MAYLIDIIDTTNEPNIIQEMQKIKCISHDEWIYMGCFIQKSKHPQLIGNYEVFKNDKRQTHIGRCYTFAEAKKLCIENKCDINYLTF